MERVNDSKLHDVRGLHSRRGPAGKRTIYYKTLGRTHGKELRIMKEGSAKDGFKRVYLSKTAMLQVTISWSITDVSATGGGYAGIRCARMVWIERTGSKDW